MRTIFPVLFFLIVFAEYSCKHEQKTVTGKSDLTSAQAIEQETFVQGCVDKNAGNNKKALEDFLKCLVMNPKSAAANYEVAGLYSQTNEFDRALTYAKAATDLAPENVWYKLRYAELLNKSGQLTESMKVYKDISDSHPADTDFLFRYATALRLLGKNDDALKVYDKIESIEGISDTLANEKIAVYEITGDKTGEENTLKNLVKYFPTEKNYSRLVDFNDANHKNADAVLLAWSQDFPQAIRPQLKSAELKLKSTATGEHPKGFAIAENAFALPREPDAKISFLNFIYPIADSSGVLSVSEKMEADTLCAILRKTHPEDARVYSISADYLFKEGKNTDAREFYHKAASLGQSEYAPWKKLMEINYNLKDDVAQEKDCKEAIDLFPTQPDPYYYLALVYYHKNDFKKADNWIQLGLDLSPDDARMNETKGDIQYRLGNADAALTFWTRAREKGGTNPALERKISSKKMNDNE
jgi:tetratricopeptide (TPR) repeat protein